MPCALAIVAILREPAEPLLALNNSRTLLKRCTCSGLIGLVRFQAFKAASMDFKRTQ